MDFTLYNYLRKALRWLRKALNWLAPAKCIRCEKPYKKTYSRSSSEHQHPCCVDCYPKLPFQGNACAQCGEPYAGVTDSCGRCLANPPNFNACFCPFEYTTPISELIIHFKYHEKPELAENLAQLLAFEIEQNNIEIPELLLPVPMHIKRLRQRGYNQSSLLAQKLGDLLDIPVNYRALEKIKLTEQQAKQTLKQRKNNVIGSFSLKNKLPVKSVAIIDDVVTTGSTAGEIAKILKKNGVDYVQVWGVAHTL